ncbi:MAG: D-glycero-beta-D-manno-heptose 1-phosphate adenylyltransferase [Deltaproteobacteria bacterium]|nr:D-glycero-beta-D-manno-heptose 1-phosphate adenylyltransferase [Deltaproteobacteria bacterium]MBW2662813.1 D-glycero-beta-D-manno-heptose 1-phosphate adenylyltransferase [Deltaproteobacteria bacterium]
MLSKIIKSNDLVQKVLDLHSSGKRIVFTNGCFDIMHVGHVRYLAAARAEGNVLIVGLNSDKSVKLIKGNKRPIVPQDQRAEVLSGMWFVDYIIIFHEPDPLKLIQAIKPDVLVKGEDWLEADIIGADFVKANGGRVIRVPMVSNVSTSLIIENIKQHC